jgi:hypothetical protein
MRLSPMLGHSCTFLLHVVSGSVVVAAIAVTSFHMTTSLEPTDHTALTGQVLQVFQSEEDIHMYLERRRQAAERVKMLEAERALAHAAAPQGRGDNKMGVYITAGNAARAEFVNETIDSLLAAGGSAIVIDVKGSFVYFHTSSPLAGELDLVRPLYELPAIVATAKEKGVYTIARLIAAKDPVFSARNPEVRIRHPRTNIAVGDTWVDLSNPTVLEYNRQVIRDVVASGIDEINIDYIRYPTEFGNSAIGLTGSEKADRIEQFVRMARETINQYGSTTRLGLSTYAILGWNYPVNLEPLGQDFVRFAPLVDIISPMAYPQTFAEGAYYNPATDPRSRMYFLVYRTLTGYAELLGPEHSHKIRPWIQGYYVTNQNFRDQAEAVFDAGHCGFTVWSAGNHYDVPYAVIPTLTIPDRCKGA